MCNKLLVGQYSMDPMQLLWRITPLACAEIAVMVYIFEGEEVLARWDEITSVNIIAHVLLSGMPTQAVKAPISF